MAVPGLPQLSKLSPQTEPKIAKPVRARLSEASNRLALVVVTNTGARLLQSGDQRKGYELARPVARDLRRSHGRGVGDSEPRPTGCSDLPFKFDIRKADSTSDGSSSTSNSAVCSSGRAASTSRSSII